MNSLKKQQMLNWCAMIGELLVLIGAVGWMFWRPSLLDGDGIVMWLKGHGAGLTFLVGAVLMTIGRLLGENGDIALMNDVSVDIRTRRLHRQRVIAMVMLMLAGVLVNLRAGFYAFDIYFRPSLWLLPFIYFVVIETYTVFRMKSPSESSKE